MMHPSPSRPSFCALRSLGQRFFGSPRLLMMLGMLLLLLVATSIPATAQVTLNEQVEVTSSDLAGVNPGDLLPLSITAYDTDLEPGDPVLGRYQIQTLSLTVGSFSLSSGGTAGQEVIVWHDMINELVASDRIFIAPLQITDGSCTAVFRLEVSDTRAVDSPNPPPPGPLEDDSLPSTIPDGFTFNEVRITASGGGRGGCDFNVFGQVMLEIGGGGDDGDGDGIPDDEDNCPAVANPDQTDSDGDSIGDVCDGPNGELSFDFDNDGVDDDEDNCPTVENPDQTDSDGDGIGDACDEPEPDTDGDGVPDGNDNCPFDANEDQADDDGDGIGNVCDSFPDDFDNDGTIDDLDNCPTIANPGQEDTDGDGIGDACDPISNDVDTDGDGVFDFEDNCRLIPNPDQADNDGDGLGNVCDPFPDDPSDPNDADGDGVVDEEDNCPFTPNPDQADSDGDGIGDACEDDNDGDGVRDEQDNCITTPNPDQADSDGDGDGDVCDPDDGMADAGEDQTVECASHEGTEVQLDGSASVDPDGESVYSWTEGGVEIATGPTPTVTLELGVHTLTLTLEDSPGETTTDEVVITVEDTTPPEIALIGDDPLVVIRFSGEYVDPGANVSDLCDANPLLVVSGTAIDTNVPAIHTITYDAVDASNNTAQVTRTVEVIDDPDALAHAYLLLGGESIYVNKNATVTGDFFSNGTIDVDKGPANYTCNLTAIDDIDIGEDNTVDGDVTSGADVILGNNVVITGTVTENATVAAESLPPLSFTAGGSNVNVAAGATLALAPGSYGEVVVGVGGRLELTTGDYFFTRFDMKKESFLSVDLPMGPVSVNVTGKLDIGKDVVTSIAPLGASDSRYVRLKAMDKVTVDDRSLILAQIIAPEDAVQFNSEVDFTGLICANDISVDKDGILTHPGPGVTASISAPLVEEPTWEVPGERAPKDRMIKSGAIELSWKADSDEGLLAGSALATAVPEDFVLEANYPNPFNPVTTIRFGTPEAARVTLVVYDMLGRVVQRLVDGSVAAGMHAVTFEAGDLPSGMYVYRLTTPAGRFTKTMLLLK